MPLIEIALYAGRTPDQLRRLEEGVTELVVGILDVPADTVKVTFRELEKPVGQP